MDRFLIAPYDMESGLQTDVRPWLITDTAFSQLNNAYVFRGRVRKRFGSRYLLQGDLAHLGTRLRVAVGTLAAPISPVPGASGAIGQMFSVGPDLFTVWQANGAMLSTNPLAAGTFNTATGVFAIVDPTQPAGTTIYWYPALPVMGLLTYEQAGINDEMLIAFDTKFAYQFLATGFERLANEVTPGAATWTGNDSQFFWGTTWRGTSAADRVFFVTNFNENEPNFMRFFFNNQWDNFRPPITATEFLNSARILVTFKNRLIALNTWEGNGAQLNYPNRARYSQIGSPLDVNAFRQDIPGRGNAIDCPTSEAITTVEFIKDRLIVFFERSTWELVYTGNQVYPFVWQQINTELGAESTFSIVPFDKVAIGVGNVGIHACNGSNVERIDSKIPDTVFEIHNLDSGVERVYGVRDYFVEMIYWTFPDSRESQNAEFPYPRRVLVYNYQKGTWAFNDDSITAFGYFQPQAAVTWDSTTVTWDDDESWDNASLFALFRQVIAGNQEGYVFIIDAEATTNASVLQITNMTSVPVGNENQVTLTVINHNLRQGDFIYVNRIVDAVGNFSLINHAIYQVENDPFADGTPNTIVINFSDDMGTILVGSYDGGGLISRVSNIQIQTKEYNFYAKQGRNAMVNKVDFLVDRTGITFADGSHNGSSLQVNAFASTSFTNLLDGGLLTGAAIGTGTLDTYAYNLILPFEENAARLWHSVYTQTQGQVISFQLAMNDEQMKDLFVWRSDFQLHAICIYARPTSSRFQG